MGKKLPPHQLEFYQTIDEILWKDWDPIGVSGMEGPPDEYRMYLPEVYRLAMKGDHGKIVDYLFWAATDRMGLTTQRNQHFTVADKILAARERIGLADDDA